MQYVSSRGQAAPATSAQAIAAGLAPDGGLYLPASIPKLPERFWELWADKPYAELAADVLALFLTDYTRQELGEMTAKAYGKQFSAPQAAPVTRLKDGVHVLELWHGPTSAFKDMALQMLPHLLTAALGKTGESRQVCILTATSGDTGKAALEGFRDIPGTKVMTFYPKDGVSAVQERQMTAQMGGNVNVVAVRGNFDDAQRGVKAIFDSPEAAREADKQGWFFSSANSINVGRLLPQIAYYVSAYRDMVNSDAVPPGEPINVCVPTGNFGNIYAAFAAMKMGVPIRRLLCASNRNNVLTGFIQDGVYDRNRPFYNTTSPSMDILVSSNVERLLYRLTGDGDWVRGAMDNLTKTGRYQLPEAAKQTLQDHFTAGWFDDHAVRQAITAAYNEHGKLIDPHTAVGLCLCDAYRTESGDATPILAAGTASPFKFPEAVLAALGEKSSNPVRGIEELAALTGQTPPAPLQGIMGKTIRFDRVIEPDAMMNEALGFLSTAYA